MAMRYANRADVLNQLSIDASDVDTIARIERLENGLCEAFDQKIGRSFGVEPVTQTRETTWRDGASSPRLILSVPVRSVTSIVTGGDWDGTQWLDGDTVPPADYRLTLYDDRTGGYWAIDGVRNWSGTVRITAIWDDQETEAVPDDVRESLTFLTVDEYRTRNASPAGEIGPDGLVIPTRNPWTFTLVREAVHRHRIVRLYV